MKLKALLLVSVLATPAFADTNNNKLSNDEVQTIQHVHHVNQMEIDLAKVAQKQGSPAVQALAAEILKDHQQADKDLMSLAAKKKVTATTETTDDKQADKDMQKDVDHLKTLRGKDFDKDYATMMYDGHTKEISKIDAAISSQGDTDLKGYLEKIKPNLQKHADDAKQLQTKANS